MDRGDKFVKGRRRAPREKWVETGPHKWDMAKRRLAVPGYLHNSWDNPKMGELERIVNEAQWIPSSATRNNHLGMKEVTLTLDVRHLEENIIYLAGAPVWLSTLKSKIVTAFKNILGISPYVASTITYQTNMIQFDTTPSTELGPANYPKFVNHQLTPESKAEIGMKTIWIVRTSLKRNVSKGTCENFIDDAAVQEADEIERFEGMSSGWVFLNFIKISIRYGKAEPLFMGAFQTLPPSIANKYCCINIKNCGDIRVAEMDFFKKAYPKVKIHPIEKGLNVKDTSVFCVIWCILRAYMPINDHPERFKDLLDKWEAHPRLFTLGDLKFPLSLNDMRRFEKMNPHIPINVYTLERLESSNKIIRNLGDDDDEDVEYVYNPSNLPSVADQEIDLQAKEWNHETFSRKLRELNEKSGDDEISDIEMCRSYHTYRQNYAQSRRDDSPAQSDDDPESDRWELIPISRAIPLPGDKQNRCMNDNAVDLLCHKGHFILIKDFQKLTASATKKGHRALAICKKCFTTFPDYRIRTKGKKEQVLVGSRYERLADHWKYCQKNESGIIEMPKSKPVFLSNGEISEDLVTMPTFEFKDFSKQRPNNYIITIDYECALVPKEMSDQKAGSVKLDEHKASAYTIALATNDRQVFEYNQRTHTEFGYKIVESETNGTEYLITFTDVLEDAALDSIKRLSQITEAINYRLKPQSFAKKSLKKEREDTAKFGFPKVTQRVPLTTDEMIDYDCTKRCWLCDKPFCGDKLEDEKIAQHDVVTGLFFKAAHHGCAHRYRISNTIPIFAHNLKGYDSSFILQALSKSKPEDFKNIMVIANSIEKLLTFKVDNCAFLDSFQHLADSLERIVKTHMTPSEPTIANVREAFGLFITEEMEIPMLKYITEISMKEKDDIAIENLEAVLHDILLKIHKELIEKLATEDCPPEAFAEKFLEDLVEMWKKYNDARTKTHREKHFKNTLAHLGNKDHFHLLSRKGVFPYQWYDSHDRKLETSLPPKEAWFNTLSDEHISDGDYEYACKVWKEMKCKTFEDYIRIYVELDTLLLLDVMQGYRHQTLKDTGLDPALFVTSPALSMASCLKMVDPTTRTTPKPHLLTDQELYNFFDTTCGGLRGGYSGAAQRILTANNRYMKKWDPTKPSTFVTYLDVNSMYPTAMLKRLPYSDFTFGKDDRVIDDLSFATQLVLATEDDDDIGRHYEVDIECTDRYWQDQQVELAMVLETRTVTRKEQSPYNDKLLGTREKPNMLKKDHISMSGPSGQKKETTGLSASIPFDEGRKLIGDLHPKKNYVCYGANLKYYIQHGWKITKVHRYVEYRQTEWLKPWIESNIKKRAKTNSEFLKNQYKLNNNSTYGKTMMNPRKHCDTRIATNAKIAKKLMSDIRTKNWITFGDSLAIFMMTKKKTELNQPVYAGNTILEISKLLMVQFFYDTLVPRYGIENLKLAFTDTDSICLRITTDDWYQDMIDMNLEKPTFDLSGCGKNFRTLSGNQVYSEKNRKKTGLMKPEEGTSIIAEVISLKAKMYSMIDENDKQINSTAKGVKKDSKKFLQHQKYKNTIELQHCYSVDQGRIASDKHVKNTILQQKAALNPLNDKRYMINHTNSYPYGYYKIGEDNKLLTQDQIDALPPQEPFKKPELGDYDCPMEEVMVPIVVPIVVEEVIVFENDKIGYGEMMSEPEEEEREEYEYVREERDEYEYGRDCTQGDFGMSW
jgi:hypothetical protein